MNLRLFFVLCALIISRFNAMASPTDTVYVHVWTDIVCPFCAIGERHLDDAANAFFGQTGTPVVLIPHAFRLQPDMQVAPGTSAYAALAEAKGISEAESRSLHASVTQRAVASGLSFNFDRAIPANTTRAHHLLARARAHGCSNEVLRRLFAAYFWEGKDVADPTVLENLFAASCTLPPGGLTSDSAAEAAALADDEHAARLLGIRAVPHFIFTTTPATPDRAAATRAASVQGAQPSSVLLDALHRTVEGG